MNIIVKPYGCNLCYCRPDTTWERENRDFYSPDCVNEVHWTPIVFARVSKAGKCVGAKFASRYYDGVGCGMLMYCRIQDEQDFSSCVDHTSILPMPLYNPVVLEDDKEFVIVKGDAGDDNDVFPNSQNSWKQLLEEAICSASQLTSLRIGDFIAVELSPKALLTSSKGSELQIKGLFCENESFNFKIIF